MSCTVIKDNSETEVLKNVVDYLRSVLDSVQLFVLIFKMFMLSLRTADFWKIMHHTVQWITLTLNSWNETPRFPHQDLGWHCYCEKAKVTCWMGNHLNWLITNIPRWMCLESISTLAIWLHPLQEQSLESFTENQYLYSSSFKVLSKMTQEIDNHMSGPLWNKQAFAALPSLPAASSGPLPWIQEPHFISTAVAAML